MGQLRVMPNDKQGFYLLLKFLGPCKLRGDTASTEYQVMEIVLQRWS